MKRSIAKISIVLIITILLPTLFFTAYEITNLNQNEQVIDSIYSSQLSSIVFSLNEFSNDAVIWYADIIDREQIVEETFRDSIFNDLVNQFESIENCFLLLGDSIAYNYENGNVGVETLEIINKALTNEQQEINRLLTYIENGYRKIQPIKLNLDNKAFLVFALNNPTKQFNLCAFLINSEKFTIEKLGPKMQFMGQDQFFISVRKKSTSETVFTNEIFEANDHKLRTLQELWLLPNMEVGIQLNGDPIEELVNKRTKTNIISIIVLDIILLLGAWFVFRNIRQEMKLAQIKSEFVSNVSHEIKTPLALISMYSETLELNRVKTEEKKKEYIHIIHTEANRLSRMVNKILNFSKIESGKRTYNFTQIDLNNVINSIIENYQHHFKNIGFEYSLNISEKSLPIECDQEAITDAIYNLIDNAIKYSNEIKKVEINTGIEGKMGFVEIKDFGIGISQNNLNLIFDKFYRVTSGDLAHKAKGSGIGLNIVKHIMDAHMGKVSVQSKLNEGSSFKLMFPLK